MFCLGLKKYEKNFESLYATLIARTIRLYRLAKHAIIYYLGIITS